MMRWFLLLSLGLGMQSMADDPTDNGAPPAAPRGPDKPVVAPIIARVDPQSAGKLDPGEGPDAVHFTAEARWLIAGYNDTEIVYTIFLKSEDTRIVRCTTLVKGAYLENGKKIEVADRQTTTLFPDQQSQAGNWMGLDEKSGATYSVKCRPI